MSKHSYQLSFGVSRSIASTFSNLLRTPYSVLRARASTYDTYDTYVDLAVDDTHAHPRRTEQ